MPPVNRNQPKRAKTSESSYSLMEFMREFPDDRTCLDWLWRERFAPDGHTAHCPKCGQSRRFHRVESRPSYSCDTCGHHLHPTAGTIFHKSSTSLHLWFYAMYLMTSTRCGISAKHLERELGVTYKTAWRMAHLIRNKLMEQDDDRLMGDKGHVVEADETWWGGRPKASQTRGMTRPEYVSFAKLKKTPVVGIMERGGDVRLVASQPGERAPDAVRSHVAPDATLVTDDWVGYRKLNHPGEHYTIAHKDRIYSRGFVHTNSIEGFFGNVKRGISGNHHYISNKWLQGYLNEYAWRHNNRRSKDGRKMFRALIGHATNACGTTVVPSLS